VVEAVLDDLETAPIDHRLRETLRFLRTLTLDPDALGPSDAERALAAGVSPEALEDAVDVCTLFNVIDRIADALGFDLPEPDYWERVAPGFLAGGYADPASPMR
jgi:alkylhydroperoxidase family enzyme